MNGQGRKERAIGGFTMIDVFFSEGAAYTWYLSTIPVEERTDEPIQEFESIIYLPFLFDLGDFSDGISSTSREDLFCEIHRSKFSSEAELRSRFCSLTKQWQRLEKEAQRGATFRIWVGPSANDGCGLYFLCSILKDIEVSLSVVHRPPYQLTPFKSLVFFRNWDEITENYFQMLVQGETVLSEIEKKVFAMMWENQLKTSPLRVMLEGKVLGVSEDFYDSFIRWQLLKGSTSVTDLIRNLVLENELSLHEGWYTKRIKAMLETGICQVVVPSDEFDDQVIKWGGES